MKIQGRIVSKKRHTVGYKVGGRNITRTEAVRLARQGKIEGVTVRTGSKDEMYLASKPGHPRLYDLPVRQQKDIR
jgi:hypothetical protein